MCDDIIVEIIPNSPENTAYILHITILIYILYYIYNYIYTYIYNSILYYIYIILYILYYIYMVFKFICTNVCITNLDDYVAKIPTKYQMLFLKYV